MAESRRQESPTIDDGYTTMIVHEGSRTVSLLEFEAEQSPVWISGLDRLPIRLTFNELPILSLSLSAIRDDHRPALLCATFCCQEPGIDRLHVFEVGLDTLFAAPGTSTTVVETSFPIGADGAPVVFDQEHPGYFYNGQEYEPSFGYADWVETPDTTAPLNEEQALELMSAINFVQHGFIPGLQAGHPHYN